MKYPATFEELADALALPPEEICATLNRRRHRCRDNWRYHDNRVHFCSVGLDADACSSSTISYGRCEALAHALLYREEERLCDGPQEVL